MNSFERALAVLAERPGTVTLEQMEPEHYSRLTGLDGWRGVHSLHLSRAPGGPDLQALECSLLVGDPVMGALREVTGLSLRTLDRLGAWPRPLPLERIGVMCWPVNANALWRPLPSLPMLKAVTLTDCMELNFKMATRAPWIGRLKSLQGNLHGELSLKALGELLETGRQLEYLQLGAQSAVKEREGWALSLVSDEAELDELQALVRRAGKIASLKVRLPRATTVAKEQLEVFARGGQFKLAIEETGAQLRF